MYSVKMFLKYVDSHTALKMQCSLSHSLVQYLALKSDSAIYTFNFFFFFLNKQPCLCNFSLWGNTFGLVSKSGLIIVL